MLSVEHFGEISGEKLLLSGDEEKRESDQEETSVAMSSVKKAAPKAVSIQEPSPRSVYTVDYLAPVIIKFIS